MDCVNTLLTPMRPNAPMQQVKSRFRHESLYLTPDFPSPSTELLTRSPDYQCPGSRTAVEARSVCQRLQRSMLNYRWRSLRLAATPAEDPRRSITDIEGSRGRSNEPAEEQSELGFRGLESTHWNGIMTRLLSHVTRMLGVGRSTSTFGWVDGSGGNS